MEEKSNLCGCRVGVLAVRGSSDAMTLENLLSVLQHGLIAELQMKLGEKINYFQNAASSSPSRLSALLRQIYASVHGPS